MSPDLMALIDQARGSRSKNEQINEWLWSKAIGDQADRIADALRPLLVSMPDDDREAFVGHAISAIGVLSANRSRKRP